jgi:hypothetical protein
LFLNTIIHIINQRLILNKWYQMINKVENFLFGVYSFDKELNYCWRSQVIDKAKEIFSEIYENHLDLTSEDFVDNFSPKKTKKAIFNNKNIKIIDERTFVLGLIQKIYIKILGKFYNYKLGTDKSKLWSIFLQNVVNEVYGRLLNLNGLTDLPNDIIFDENGDKNKEYRKNCGDFISSTVEDLTSIKKPYTICRDKNEKIRGYYIKLKESNNTYWYILINDEKAIVQTHFPRLKLKKTFHFPRANANKYSEIDNYIKDFERMKAINKFTSDWEKIPSKYTVQSSQKKQ